MRFIRVVCDWNIPSPWYISSSKTLLSNKLEGFSLKMCQFVCCLTSVINCYPFKNLYAWLAPKLYWTVPNNNWPLVYLLFFCFSGDAITSQNSVFEPQSMKQHSESIHGCFAVSWPQTLSWSSELHCILNVEVASFYNCVGLEVTLPTPHPPPSRSTLALSNPPLSRSWMRVVPLCPALPPLFQGPMFPFVRPSGFQGRCFLGGARHSL